MTSGSIQSSVGVFFNDDMSTEKFYINTAIAYTNAGPHLGHALEFIQADAIARYHRMMGYDTWFVTGTDEHGIKNYNTAKKTGIDTLNFVHSNADQFKALKSTLDISFDDFIQTTDQDRHWSTAQKIWKQLEAAGDIYQKEYEGLYCEGCEMFLKETDLVDGCCAIHKKPPTPSKETNYFFRLSKYSDKIVRLIESGEVNLAPAFRQNEFLTLAREGLHDVSFSRPKSSLPWGVPVPGDPNQTMYVWCDALTNYLSALGFSNNDSQFERYWPSDVILIGKDIVRFHAGVWIGMLLSVELTLPKTILAHGFVTHNGEKMSKTIGNVVDPIEVVNQYGKDALRFYLLREIPMGNDGDFSEPLFIERYNAELANNLGNLVNRVHRLVSKNNVSPALIQSSHNGRFQNEVSDTWNAYCSKMKEYKLSEGIQACWKLINFANKQMEVQKPWAMLKEDQEAGKQLLADFLELLRHVSLMISPIIPHSAQIIRQQLGLKEGIDASKKTWGAASDWGSISEAIITFPRIENKES